MRLFLAHHARAVLAAALAVTIGFGRPSLFGAQAGSAGIAGRWEFRYEGAAPGRAGSGPPSARTITLELKAGPAKTLTGTLANTTPGARGNAPGNNPLRPVEIADGTVDGNRVSFTAWQFDGYKNRIRFEGGLDGDVLRLTMSRETAAGLEKIDVIAKRLPY